jgi:VCBS repeat-containing protein
VACKARQTFMATSLRACVVTAFLLLSSAAAHAQTGSASVRLAGQVSGAVAVSVPEGQTLSEGVTVAVADTDQTTVAVSIYGSGDGKARVRLPLQLRSNVGYELRASFDSKDALDVRLSVAGLRATGRFVHADALDAVRPGAALAGPQDTHLLTIQNRPSPFAVLSGGPISKAGTFSSPDNAVEVVLSIEVQPQTEGRPWSTRLTLSAAPSR